MSMVTMRKTALAFCSSVFWLAPGDVLLAQEGALRPGEAFVTRFSGVQQSGPQENPIATIDVNGTVGSILDIRSPQMPPRGEHWINEPQRSPITAGAVGQVFGVALDDANPPNIYLTSTSAFGLHHAGNQWMPGMWGPGGPAAIYKLTPGPGGYRPALLSSVTLNGRPNTGAALGNIAYDKTNRQLFVSDLETGMIHRVSVDGADGGFYDHGGQGRANFMDGTTRQPKQLPPINFDPNSRARFADCPAQPADSSPECWNFAANGRRIWGLGVRVEGVGKVRLYYSVWSSPAYDPEAWGRMTEEDKRNSVWSIGIGPDGNFMPQDVRREFVMPDFFIDSDDIARAGYSSPVSDISFPVCSSRPVMLVAERGGIRNLGLAAENAFSTPHEARTVRFELDTNGTWRPIGRYDIGFYDRQKDGLPFIHANCAGGVAFGPDYSPAGQADTSKPDQFVWITGDSLCGPDGPCNLPGAPQQATGPGGVQPASQQQQQDGDDSEVHGVQGNRETAIAELAPVAAYQQNTNDPNATAPARAPNEAYLIDTDINVDQAGNPIEAELLRNDATLIGDIAIYQICQQIAPQTYALLPAPPAIIPDEPITWVGHPAEISHSQYASHGRDMSHYRWGSHYWRMSHGRYQSHSPYQSHDWRMSGWHNTYWSHWPRLSHRRWGSDQHWRSMSPAHNVYLSPKHRSHLSENHRRSLSPGHVRPLSPGHFRHVSPGHRLPLSPNHNQQLSFGHKLPMSPHHNHILSKGKHSQQLSTPGLHSRSLSPGQHNHSISQRVPGGNLHNRVLSGSTQHKPQVSNASNPKHNNYLSGQKAKQGPDRHYPQGSNAGSQHDQKVSNAGKSHSPRVSNASTPKHNQQASNAQKHNTQVSNAQSKQNKQHHNSNLSRSANKPQHNQQVSNASKKPQHSQRVSNAQNKPKVQGGNNQKKTHNAQVSNAGKNKVIRQQSTRQQNFKQQTSKQNFKPQQNQQRQRQHNPKNSHFR